MVSMFLSETFGWTVVPLPENGNVGSDSRFREGISWCFNLNMTEGHAEEVARGQLAVPLWISG